MSESSLFDESHFFQITTQEYREIRAEALLMLQVGKRRKISDLPLFFTEIGALKIGGQFRTAEAKAQTDKVYKAFVAIKNLVQQKPSLLLASDADSKTIIAAKQEVASIFNQPSLLEKAFEHPDLKKSNITVNLTQIGSVNGNLTISNSININTSITSYIREMLPFSIDKAQDAVSNEKLLTIETKKEISDLLSQIKQEQSKTNPDKGLLEKLTTALKTIAEALKAANEAYPWLQKVVLGIRAWMMI
jgi:hypothetical protein